MNEEELLAQMFGRRSGQTKPRISHEGQIARLRELATQLDQPSPYVVGDLITPREGGNTHGAGEPHLVIAVFDEPLTNVGSEPHAHGYAKVYDMKVACVMGDVDCLFVAWSGDYD